jgi:NADPH-dependent 2,4-dienoyl-CoA reductase/sulfur reductase-like enzyme
MAAKQAVQKVLIVGGVAGGASCAARLRRLSEAVQITILEKGPYVSFANCGLPYHIGGVIPEESSLLVASAAKFNNWFNVKVQENTEVVAIDRAARTITARGPGGEERHEYDALVLSPGAFAIKPPLPGIELPGIFQMKTIPDTCGAGLTVISRICPVAAALGCQQCC